MTEDASGLAAMFGGAPIENPATPGYHVALIGGSAGPFGQPLSVCISCAALVPDADNAREFHTRFHDQIKAIAKLALGEEA